MDNKGSIHIQANRGMYGLSQDGLLEMSFWKNIQQERLPTKQLVPGFWTHKWSPVQITLVVDNFGVKYVGKEHAIQLKNTIEEN